MKIIKKKAPLDHPMATETVNAITFSDLPEDVRSHPGMISVQERILLYSLAKNAYRGKGLIIDAGTFLGASTMAFGRGLEGNPSIALSSLPDHPIRGYERAIAGANLAVHTAKAGLPNVPVGESFADLLRAQIAPVARLTKLHVGNILEYNGEDLGDIEICFLDILKTPAVASHAMQVFYPKLLPGAYVIQQDYFFQDLPFVKVFNEALADKFRYLGEVRSSALFQLMDPISADELEDAFAAYDSLERSLTLHKQAEARTISPARQYMMRLSRSLLYSVHREIDKATETLEEANRQFADVVKDGDGKFQENMGWRVDRILGAIRRRMAPDQKPTA